MAFKDRPDSSTSDHSRRPGPGFSDAGDSNYNTNQPPVAYRNAREYAQALRPWLWQYQTCVMHSMAANFAVQMQALSFLSSVNNNHYFSLHTTHSRLRVDPYAERRSQTSNINGSTPHTQPPQQGNVQGVVMKIPTFWKRVAAELIDFTFLFYIKMIVSLFLVTELSLGSHIYCTLLFCSSLINSDDLIETFTELDYDRAFAITFEVIALEVINRILITIFETLCLYRTLGARGVIGATPGKRLMGLKVVSCDSVQCLGHGQVLVSPAGNVSFKNAFLRSIIKNFTIAFFLPACLTLFFFKHNRTAYDVVAHTIVVEDA
ncbi:unnamed protein product [Candidula unifasciata]|uniref:RDD domain-containing protein n=1 Tax=Candidula unifasciata TaxID=100452 RepID=A0A8S3YWM6_9EUPU|nr:unnamed protein product [Candidula unifasciata]